MSAPLPLPTTTDAWVHNGTCHDDAPLAESLELQELALPPLKLGDALLRVDAAPVNPSDTMFVRGLYGKKPRAGNVPGFEGCGTVLAANAGPYGWWLKGRRVSFGSQGGQGSWTRFAVVSAFSCIPVSKTLPVEAAATLIVNPMTALGLLARARKHGTKAIVVNAANSALGKYLLKLASAAGIGFIGLVRSAESAKALHDQGAKHVLVTTDESFAERLREVCQQLQAYVLLDAVAGEETALVMHAMPDRSLAIVYGDLSQESIERGDGITHVAFDTTGLVFRQQKVEGYWLTDELHGANGIFTPLWRARKISQLYKQGVFTIGDITATSLEDLVPAIDRGVHGSKLAFMSAIS